MEWISPALLSLAPLWKGERQSKLNSLDRTRAKKEKEVAHPKEKKDRSRKAGVSVTDVRQGKAKQSKIRQGRERKGKEESDRGLILASADLVGMNKNISHATSQIPISPS